MRHSSAFAAFVVTSLLAGTAGAALPGAAAQAAPVTRIVSFTVPADPVDLEATEGAVIRAHIVDPVGLAVPDPVLGGEDSEFTVYLLIREEGSAIAGGGYVAPPRLVSGTPKDGQWEFGPFAGKRAFGGWDAYRLHIGRLDGTRTDINLPPLGFRTVFRTIGRFGSFFDQQSPATTQDTAISYGSPVTLRARLYWNDELSGRHAIPGVRVTVLQEDAQEPTIDGDEREIGSGTTRSDGSIAITVTPQRNAFRLYLQADKGTSPEGVRFYAPIAWTGKVTVQVRVNVTAKPSALPVGTIGYVEGNVVPLHAGQNIYLQRNTSSGWKTVSTATIRASGRYTLAAQPPLKGKLSYRVYKASDTDHFGRTTAAFTITGT